MEFQKQFVKDIGIDEEVMDALPYAVVGGTWEGSFDAVLVEDTVRTVLNHIVPSGQQLKVLFLRIWTQEAQGARFRIIQTNPTAAGNTGAVEAYPVVNNVPSGVRDYPFLEAAGGEVLHGGLKDPIHVLEGSVNFDVMGATPATPTGARYGYVWWGVEKVPRGGP